MFPPGITSFDPMPMGYRRWNGAVWADCQVAAYNAELARIESRHRAGMNVRHLVNGLYNLAQGFDRCATRERKRNDEHPDSR